MALEMRHRVIVIRFQRQIASRRIALEEYSFLPASRHPVKGKPLTAELQEQVSKHLKLLAQLKMPVLAFQARMSFIVGPSICFPLLLMLCTVSKNARYRGIFS